MRRATGRLIRLQLITWVSPSLDSLQIASDVADPTLIKDGLRCLQSGLRSTLTLFAENNYTVNKQQSDLRQTEACNGRISGGSCFESR